MRRCDIKKRYTDRIELADEVLDMLLAHLAFSSEGIKSLSRRMNVHSNTLYLFTKGKTLPINKILMHIKSFLQKELKSKDESR